MNKQIEENYLEQIGLIHQTLGIVEDYATSRGLECQVECEDLVETELDVFSRQPLMEASAFQAWQKMKVAALKVNIILEIISAYRSAEYQKSLFLKKMEKGQSLLEILKVNAAPGYSEHHSGQALDIACPGYEHLSEEFELSPAFKWLCENSGSFGFSLSFPKDNAYGFLYEPWHWRFSENISETKG